VCADNLEDLRFGEPELLEGLGSGDQNVHMVRETASPEGFVYAVGGAIHLRQIWWTRSLNEPGEPLEGVDDPTQGEANGLYAPISGNGPLGGLNFFFERTLAAHALARRALFGGVLGSDGKVAGVVRLPAPYNLDDSQNRTSFDLAVAGEGARAWWAASRPSTLLGLFTASLDATDVDAADPVNVTTAPGNCGATGLSAAPWVTPDGRWGFFSAEEKFDNCMSRNTQNDLFLVELEEGGQAAGIAQPLEDINLEAVDDVQASLSKDACFLFFSSDRGGSNTLRAYRAKRR
jgi:hypothetical protein